MPLSCIRRSKLLVFILFFLFEGKLCNAQLAWKNVTADYGELPKTIRVFKTTDSLESKPSIAYYVSADLNDPALNFTVDTTLGRRLTPRQFYEKNSSLPFVVVNSTFFNFDKNQNLNVVIKDGKMVGFNIHAIAMKGKDTLKYRHPFGSAIGISSKRKADVAWLYTDSSFIFPYAFQKPILPYVDSFQKLREQFVKDLTEIRHWGMVTAVGGGPVLVQNGKLFISNEEEMKFVGKAINDKHPRTAMGYTKDGRLIILAVQGRFPGIAEGATLEQEARILMSLGCVEALNLDGGGSSCLLVNGKETIKPSSEGIQRPVPAVFMIMKQKPHFTY